MIVYCDICGHKIQSSKTPEEAQKHVVEQMTKHIETHPEQQVMLAQTVTLFATYVLIKRYMRIPPEEKEFHKTFDIAENLLLDVFGLEPENSTQPVEKLN